jgi:hypothetical protein
MFDNTLIHVPPFHSLTPFLWIQLGGSSYFLVMNIYYMNDKSHFFLVKSPLITMYPPLIHPPFSAAEGHRQAQPRPGSPWSTQGVVAHRSRQGGRGQERPAETPRLRLGTTEQWNHGDGVFVGMGCMHLCIVSELMIKMNGWGIIIVVICSYSFFGGLMIDVVSICFKDDLAPKQWSKVVCSFLMGILATTASWWVTFEGNYCT